MKQNYHYNLLKPHGMDTCMYSCSEFFTSPLFLNFFGFLAFVVVYNFLTSTPAFAGEIFGVNTDTGQISSGTQFTGDTKELMTSTTKLIKWVRWGCLALATMGMCWGAIKFQGNDRHEEAWKILIRSAVAFVIIVLSIPLTNYIVGAFN